MAVDQYQNAYVTKLRESCSADADVIFVDTPPTITQGTLTIDFSNQTKREIIHFTGVDGYKLTGVTRGLEDTVAQTHTIGTDIRQNVTAGMVTRMMAQIVDAVYPIGSIYMSTTLSTPEAVSAAIGGDWQEFGIGRTLVSVDPSDSDFETPEKLGGAKTRNLSAAIGSCNNDIGSAGMRLEGPSAYQSQNRATYVLSTGEQGFSHWNHSTVVTEHSSTDRGTSMLQPYITTYMFKRIA